MLYAAEYECMGGRIGGLPFSWGGNERHFAKIYFERYDDNCDDTDVNVTLMDV